MHTWFKHTLHLCSAAAEALHMALLPCQHHAYLIRVPDSFLTKHVLHQLQQLWQFGLAYQLHAGTCS